MSKINFFPVGPTGRKMVEFFPNNVALTLEEDSINCSKWNDGKVSISITVNGKNNGGYTYEQNLKEELPTETISIAEFLGARVNKGEILYGTKFVDKKAKISKLNDMRVIAQYISESLLK